jgi:hypothetical protein
MLRLFVFGLAISSVAGFTRPAFRKSSALKVAIDGEEEPAPIATVPATSWQEDLDALLDIEGGFNIEARAELLTALVNKFNDFQTDATGAWETKDITKVAPKTTKYGKAVAGLQALQRQFVNDIVPDTLTKAFPKIFDKAPELLSGAISAAPEVGGELFKKVQELASDSAAFEATVEELKKSAQNVIKSPPVGLETPVYSVISKNDEYEIREYLPYSVCTTKMVPSAAEDEEVGMSDPLSVGTAFVDLASYISGKNDEKMKIAMTTPVILNAGFMEFPLAGGLTAETAPAVVNGSVVEVKDVPGMTVAVREFPGIATDGEISRQRALLEDSLLTEGVLYDNLSFKVLQYNPPQTLPWLRRNEVILTVTGKTAPKTTTTFTTAPEAGD